MAFINEENKRKTEQIVRDIREYAVLADNEDPNAVIVNTAYAPGVGLPAEAAALRTRCRDIEDGIFKTLVMGKFKNGKSTFINALVGKIMMASKATACTAVIATVEFGNDCDMVDVIYTDKEPRRMTLQQFTEEFQLSEDEEKIIEDEGKLSRFENVSHVEMHSKDELFKDGFHLIDSPGLEEAVSRTKTTNEYVPKANAIIFTLNAVSLFSAKEKEYISENFAGKHMRNVFFVVNRIDNLTPGQLQASVIPTVRAGLEDVFLDDAGNFNEELYSNRVFFTNAYGAQCVRTNEPYKIIVGKKEVVVPMDLEDTGMLEFEAALRVFLNSEERIRATFSSTLTSMANTYQTAEKNVNAEIAARSLSGTERKQRVAEAQTELKKAVDEVEGMRKTIKSSAGIVASSVYLDLVTYAQNDLPREFAASAKNKDFQNKFGMGGMLKLAGAMAASALPINGLRDWAARTQMNVLQPFADKINSYIKQKIEDEWPKRIPILTKQELDDLKDQLDAHAAEFDVSMNRALQAFSGNNAKIDADKKGSLKSGLQAILALSNWDVSLATGAMAEGGLSWGEFIKRAAVQLVLDGAVTIVLGAPFLIPALLIEILSLHYRKGQMADQLLTTIGNGAFEKLTEELKNREMSIKKEITDQIVGQGEKIAAAGDQIVAEQRARMEKLLKEDATDTAAARAENDRLTANLERMHELVEDVFMVLHGHIPTETEFTNLSRNEKAG